MKIVSFIQPTTGAVQESKILEKIGEKTVLEIVIDKTKRSQRVQEMVLGIPKNEESQGLHDLANKLKIRTCEGDRERILEWFLDVIRMTGADIVLRVIGENPLVDPKLIDSMIDLHLNSKADYTYPEDYPLGLTPSEVVNTTLLSLAYKLKPILPRGLRSFVTQNPSYFKIAVFKPREKYSLPFCSFAVRNFEELVFMKSIYRDLIGYDTLVQNLDFIISTAHQNSSRLDGLSDGEKNRCLNEIEKKSQMEFLKSFPKTIIFETGQRCNSKCKFCIREDYPYKDLDFNSYKSLVAFLDECLKSVTELHLWVGGAFIQPRL